MKILYYNKMTDEMGIKKDIENSQSSFEKYVDGVIETTTLPNGICIISNDTALLKSFPVTATIIHPELTQAIEIHGPFIVCERRNNTFMDLTEENAANFDLYIHESLI